MTSSFYKGRNWVGMAFLALCATWPALVGAEEVSPALNFKGIYEFSFSGIPFGRMGLEIEQTPDHYAVAADIMSTGLMRLLVQHTSHTTVDGSGHNFAYPSVDYETHYQTRKKKRYIRMSYKDGMLRQEEMIPPDAPGKRPPIAPELKNTAADPLSFLLKIRQAFLAARQSGQQSFSINVFDGRRLTEADFVLRGQKRIIYDNESQEVSEIDARRKLLGGFTESELADYNPHEGTVRLYLSNETQMMPLRLEVPFMLGTLSATLVKQCRTGESCLLGLRD